MRIAILTLPLHTNYGGILQVYALQTVLERMGHKVEVLDKKRKLFLAIPIFVLIKRFIKKYILQERITPLQWKEDYKKRARANKYTWRFADRYIHRREIQGFYEINPDDYDCIIVGSDQVWRPCYFSTNYNTSIVSAFLNFTQGWNIKRVAYAASFGTDDWEYSLEETEECRKFIRIFNAVSVREKSGLVFVKKKLKRADVCLVPDPTLLLTKDDYIYLFRRAKVSQSKGNLLVYFIDETEEKIRLIEQISELKKLKPFRVNTQIESNNKDFIEDLIQPPVEDWLRGFYDAEFVITDSYHACIFSIIFHKPFLVYGNQERGMARFKSLLSVFGLEDRLICSLDELDIESITSNLPASLVLDSKREVGYQFLKNELF